MNLVTVTCNKHHNQMMLQAESVQMYLKPCAHWIIVNEPKPDKQFWESTLSPFYTKHKLNLIFSNNEFNGNSWSRQQCYKFWIYKHIKDDYLILDSKNFFVRHTTTEEWITNFLKIEAALHLSLPGWEKVTDSYAKKLGIDNPNKSLRMHTPFVFQKEILNSIENFDDFLNWFDKQYIDSIGKSEFIFYSFLAEKMKMLDNLKRKEDWSRAAFPNNNISLPKFLSKIHSFPKIKILGIHPDIINYESSKEDIDYFNTWLSSRNFKTVIEKVDIPKHIYYSN